MFEHLLSSYGSAVVCAGTGALGAADLHMAQTLLEEVIINPTIELPELTQDWEIDSWRPQQNFVHQLPGERSSAPQETVLDLLWVSGGLQQRHGWVVA